MVRTPRMNATRIALLQHAAPSSPEAGREQTAARIRKAAAEGAQIICTPELFLTPYFCRTQDPALFELAESIPGPSTDFFRPLAKELGLVLVLSLFEKRGCGIFHNTSVILDATGEQVGLYRKSHIPQDPGFEEKFYFTPGDTGFQAFDTAHGRIGILICWDQWFPESARLTALQGADILFCPTAIGWMEEEEPELYPKQLGAWLRVQQGHAAANTCYLAAINRVGHEKGTHFWGNSFVADFTGELIAHAGEGDELLLADCDPVQMEEHRRIWPFFRDRRLDLYSPLLHHPSSS